MASENYGIPVPVRFRCAPLTRVPWAVTSFPQMVAGSQDAEADLSENIKQRYKVQHCVLTDSARSAFALFLRTNRLGGEFLTPSLMYTPLAVLLMNHDLDLVFCDVGRDFNVRIEDLESAWSPNTTGVLVQNMFGRVAPMERIWQWAKERSVTVLANMVHVPSDVQLRDKPLTSYCDAAFLSFGQDKVLRGIYGGALITNSVDIYERAMRVKLPTLPTSRVLRILLHTVIAFQYKPLLAPLHYAWSRLLGNYYEYDRVARFFEAFAENAYQKFQPYRIHPLQAAFALKLLKQLPGVVQTRINRGHRAADLLSGIRGLTPPMVDEYPNTFLSFPVLLDGNTSRYDLGCQLAKQGIETKWHYYPVHLQRKFAHFRRSSMENSDQLWKNHLFLPIVESSDEEIELIAKAVRKYYTSP